jgi:hypothetical protein
MQEGSRATDSTWREREREWKRSSPRGGAGSLLNRWRRKWGGGLGGCVCVEDGEGGRERGPWHGCRQCGALGSGPRPSGVGGAVAARIGEGGRRGRRG